MTARKGETTVKRPIPNVGPDKEHDILHFSINTFTKYCCFIRGRDSVAPSQFRLEKKNIMAHEVSKNTDASIGPSSRRSVQCTAF